MSIAPDQEQRDFAVDPGHSVIVQAPAGSGKTSLLVTRYLRLLAHASRPEEVLAITFTRKAAGEMRERILRALSENDPAAQAALQQARQRGWNLASQPHRLKIQTIDSFAMSLLRQLPLLGEFDASVTLVEQAQDLYEQAAHRLFQRLYADDPLGPYIAEFLGWLDNDFDKASRLVAEMLARRDQWLDVVQEVVQTHQADPESVRDLLAAGIRELQAGVLEALERQLSETQLQELALLVEAAAGNVDAQLNDDLARYRFAGEIFVTQQDRLRKSLTRNQGFPPEAAEIKARGLTLLSDIQEAGGESHLAHLRHLPEANIPDAALAQLVNVCIALTLAVVELGELFAQRRVADFTQLTLSARTALSKDGAPTELALALDYRIKHILVDEFQDTSVAQFQLFEQLVQGWQPDDGNTFFAVGDPMQSVYRFRDAEVGLFFQAWHQGIGHVPLERVRLRANFRAGPGLVDWGNRNFAGIFGTAEDPLLGQIAYMPAVASRSTEPAHSVRVYKCDNEGEEIARLVSTVEQLQRMDDESTVAILVRSRTHLRSLLPALRGAGINWRATDIEPLPQRPVVRDLLSLAGVLASPWDRLSWFAVLRSPWVGLCLRDLEALADDEDLPGAVAKPPDSISEDGRARLQRLQAALELAGALHDEAPPRRILETAWLSAGGTDAYPGEEDIDCAERLFELVDSLGPHGLDGKRLAAAAEMLYANDESQARLEILTIHKAKGLEFDHVLVPFLDRQPHRPDAPLMLWRPQGHALLVGIKELNDVYGWLAREDRARERHELKRLLYVACTRARESLHLLGVDQTSRSGSLFSLLEDATDEPALESQTPATAAAVQPDMFRGRTLHRLREDYHWQPPDVVTPPKPEAAAVSSGDGPDGASGWQVVLGIIMHETLRTLCSHHPLPEADDFVASHRQRWEQRARALMADDARTEQIAAEAERQVRNVLADAQGRWILSQHADAQCEHGLTGVDPDGGLVNVFLDRMFVDEQGHRWVIDYKSTTVDNISADELIASEVVRYRPQLARYGRFVAATYPEKVRLGIYFTALPRFEELGESLFQSAADLG